MRSRLLRGAFWNDRRVRGWNILKRYIFIALLAHAEDAGVFEDDVDLLMREIMPQSDPTVSFEVRRILDELVQEGRLIPYVAGGIACLYITNFYRHQKLSNPLPSGLPLPPWVVESVGQDTRGRRRTVYTHYDPETNEELMSTDDDG